MGERLRDWLAPWRRISGRTATSVAFVLLSLEVVHAHIPHDPVLAFAVSPDFARDRTVFVAVDSEMHFRSADVLKSTNGGKTWVKLPAGLENRAPITSLSVSPGYLEDRAVVATTDGDGVFEYRANRATWLPLNAGLPELRVVDVRSATSPDGGTVVFVTLKGGGLYVNERQRGVDAAWVPGLSRTIRVTALAVSPDYRLDATIAAADASGRLWLSRDAGRGWTDLGQPTAAAINGIAISPGFATRGEIFLTSNVSGILRSRDSGRSFDVVRAGLPDQPLSAVTVSPNYSVDGTIFCTGIEKAVYRSVDRGDTWTFFESGAIDTNQAQGPEMKSLVVSPGFATRPVVFLVAFDGLFRSDDGGRHWAEIQTRRGAINGVAVSPGFVTDGTVLATLYGGQGLYASFDRGATWSPASGTITRDRGHVYLMDVAFTPGVAGRPQWIASQNHYAMWITDDGGGMWRRIGLPSWPDATISAMEIAVSPGYASDGTILVATRWDGILRSVDRGVTWTAAREMVPEPVTSVAMSPAFPSDGVALAGTRDGKIWRTVDAGVTWHRVGGDTVVRLPGVDFVMLALSPAFEHDRLAVAGTNNGLWVSRDGGVTWQVASHDAVGRGRIVDQVRFSPDYARDRLLFVSVRGRGLYRCASTDFTFKRIAASLLRRHIQLTEFAFSPRFESDRTMFGVSRADVYRSLDAGVSWQRVGRLTQ
jgi:photosystem II stability/assembly factor-like uncharacterized protein